MQNSTENCWPFLDNVKNTPSPAPFCTGICFLPQQGLAAVCEYLVVLAVMPWWVTQVCHCYLKYSNRVTEVKLWQWLMKYWKERDLLLSIVIKAGGKIFNFVFSVNTAAKILDRIFSAYIFWFFFLYFWFFFRLLDRNFGLVDSRSYFCFFLQRLF